MMQIDGPRSRYDWMKVLETQEGYQYVFGKGGKYVAFKVERGVVESSEWQSMRQEMLRQVDEEFSRVGMT